jgi:SAM-dependent methyltransferase
MTKFMARDERQQIATFWNNIAHDFDAIYTGKKSVFWRGLDRILRKDIYQRFDWVMERTGDVRGKTVCDVGCGSGRFVDELARRGATRIVGVDVAPEMLKMAAQLVTENGHAHACQFVHSDVLDWKTDEKFDITIAIGFWDYIADPPERLRIIRSMTTGKFLSAWPRYWTWRMPVRKVRLNVMGCPVYFFKKERVYQMLESSGFRVERIDVVGKLFCVESRPV